MGIDWDSLRTSLSKQFALGEFSIHGLAHWERVERHAVRLAEMSGGDVLVARLFAVFHDSCRLNDSVDDAHGARGADLALRMKGHYFLLDDDRFALLHFACTYHTDGQVSNDPTIGACWDADRLDLWRVGTPTKEAYMSTAHGRDLVRTGQVGQRFTPGK